MSGLPDHLDVLIVGGGPVGAALALKLGGRGLQIGLVEARGAPGDDPRALALSWGSCEQLACLDAWQSVAGKTAIHTVHVSQQRGFGRTRLTAEESGLPALGYVVNFGELQRVLHDRLQRADVHYLTGARLTDLKTLSRYAVARYRVDGAERFVTAGLVVLADGGKAMESLPGVTQYVRDYRQSAVVADVHTDQPNAHIAYERFSESGPMALLPRGDGFALVWTQAKDTAPDVLKLSDGAFLQRLQAAFGDRAGRFLLAGPRAAFPLHLKQLSRNTAQRLALIGNAAQVMHPVAGQGFNLGLRDADDLAESILLAAPREIGSAQMLQAFGNKRRLDANLTVGFTDGLIHLFAGHPEWLRWARGSGLLLLDVLPPARRLFTRHMVFGARI